MSPDSPQNPDLNPAVVIITLPPASEADVRDFMGSLDDAGVLNSNPGIRGYAGIGQDVVERILRAFHGYDTDESDNRNNLAEINGAVLDQGTLHPKPETD